MLDRRTEASAPSAATTAPQQRPSAPASVSSAAVPATAAARRPVVHDELADQLSRSLLERGGAPAVASAAGLSHITEDPDYMPPEDESSSRIGSPRRFVGGIADSWRSWRTRVAGLLTPQDDFAGRSYTAYGVGEIIDLSFNGPQAAAWYGGLRWVIASGGGAIVTAADGTGTYTCPGDPAVVTLKLQAVGGANAAANETIARRTIEVVGIEDAWMERDTAQGLWHRQDYASVGFKGDIFFGPKTVSFTRAGMQEGTGTATATGYHKAIGKNGEVHAPTGAWVPIGPGDSAVGCQLTGTDTVATGQYAPQVNAAGTEQWRRHTFTFTAAGDKHSYNPLFWDGGPNWKGGTFSWPIPWYYQGPGGVQHTIKTVTHYETVSATGAASIKKAGSGTFTKQLDDLDSDY